jgi:hypothetical protein
MPGGPVHDALETDALQWGVVVRDLRELAFKKVFQLSSDVLDVAAAPPNDLSRCIKRTCSGVRYSCDRTLASVKAARKI